MRYFQYFPPIEYKTSEVIDGQFRTITRAIPNMTVRLQIAALTDEFLPHEWYRIQDRDRPDTLAAQWYGSSQYAWVILLTNNMRDWYDWPMTTVEFLEYIQRKYESTPGARNGLEVSQDDSGVGIYQRIWEKSTGERLVVDATTYATLPNTERTIITWYQKEEWDNDRRRDIKRLTLDALAVIVRQFQDSVKRA